MIVQEGKPRPGQLGPFDKKWLMLAVQDLAASKAAAGKEPLGRVVINLADFACEDGRATQAFTVACSRSISAAVGEAKLLVTIGCVPAAPNLLLHATRRDSIIVACMALV